MSTPINGNPVPAHAAHHHNCMGGADGANGSEKTAGTTNPEPGDKALRASEDTNASNSGANKPDIESLKDVMKLLLVMLKELMSADKSTDGQQAGKADGQQAPDTDNENAKAGFGDTESSSQDLLALLKMLKEIFNFDKVKGKGGDTGEAEAAVKNQNPMKELENMMNALNGDVGKEGAENDDASELTEPAADSKGEDGVRGQVMKVITAVVELMIGMLGGGDKEVASQNKGV